MKADRSKVRKGSSEVPSDCQKLIQYLKDCTEEELLQQLKQINVWYFGKCELYHWIDILDRFDEILASIAKPVEEKTWLFVYDVLEDALGIDQGAKKRELIHQILKFTALLIEHSYARHLYNSTEHLISLMDCGDPSIILSVLNLIYVFSKRSNYLSRITNEKRKALQQRLFLLGESWGGVEAGYALDQCSSLTSDEMLDGTGSLYFEYYVENGSSDDSGQIQDGNPVNILLSVQLDNLQEISSKPGEIMEQIVASHEVPKEVQKNLLYRLRLAHAMPSSVKRLQFVQARLQAISILVYSNSTDQVNTLIYDGFVEEIINTLELVDEEHRLSEVKASCLKTLTAIIHLDRNPRLNTIIECSGASSYHGFLPTLVRQCIQHMTDSNFEDFPQPYSTALFSFLYHLASYESGCEALVSSGLMESLLKVVQWPGEDDHITFVTRAVRVIDLITNLDMASFQSHNGLSALVKRLETEVKYCSQYHGPVLSPGLPRLISSEDKPAENETNSDESHEQPCTSEDSEMRQSNTTKETTDIDMQEPCTSSSSSACGSITLPRIPQCLPQRAALLKSVLNFLKKAIPDPAFADHARTLMDDSLQNSLKQVISNAEYYGALLFLLATDVVTVYIFHEPSMLSTLQDSGLTEVVMKALIMKDVPATRENLASLPNTLSALCLNTRGLQAFVSCKPFERLFRILITPEYLPAMKRRRSSDPQGDTAMHLGSAMDELMRHQPTLKVDAMKAIVKLCEQLCEMGRDPDFIAFHPTDKSIQATKQSTASSPSPNSPVEGGEEPMSDEDIDEEFRAVVNRNQGIKERDKVSQKSLEGKRKFVPLLEYLLNVMKFLENILSNNGTDDHCNEFVRLGGLAPLLSLLNLPNVPLEFPLLPACQSIAAVAKSVVLLSQENKVFKEGLTQLDALLDQLEPLYNPKTVKGSVLLHELASSSRPGQAMHNPTETPLLHAMAATHAYVNLFVHVCRGSQADVRSMSVNQWGSDLGTKVLKKLSSLYICLVWESSVLLTLCTPNLSDDEKIDFAKEDLEKLVPSEIKGSEEKKEEDTKHLNEAPPSPKGSTSKSAFTGLPPSRITQLRLGKWLLTSSSHLGRALAELFGLLVHQCVGSPPRLRRHVHQQITATLPSIPARLVAAQLTKLLVQGLSWECPEEITIPRLRLTFYICSVGFAAPMLFDEKKSPYHLMLQQFVLAGGLNCILKRFEWVLHQYKESFDSVGGVAGNHDGTGEFLEGWLVLVEKMVDTKGVMESQHSLPSHSSSPGFISFVPVEFLAKVQTLAFNAVMLLWGHKILKYHGNRIVDKMLSILCHIVKGESLVRGKLEPKIDSKPPEKKTELASSSASAIIVPVSVPRQPDVHAVYIQQLIDMGFTAEQARDALIQTGNNLEQATEYILTNPTSASPAVREFGMDIDLSEDDMMMRAIALSLGENVLLQEGRSRLPKTPTDAEKEKANEEVVKKEEDVVIALSKETLDDFLNNLLDGCLQMLIDMPDTVYTMHELITAVANRNGKKWRNDVLHILVKQIHETAARLVEKLSSTGKMVEELASQMCTDEDAAILATRIHLLVLLSQDMQYPTAIAIQKSDVIDHLLVLIETTNQILSKAKTTVKELSTPRWLAPLVLLLDQYEKAAVVWKRKQLQKCSHVWKWFDDRSGRWCNYSVSNNNSIDTAFHGGETSVRFTAGRRRYVVLFKVMVQINEDTGNRRPIMLDVIGKDFDKKDSAVKIASQEQTKQRSDSDTISKKHKRKRSGSAGQMDTDASGGKQGNRKASKEEDNIPVVGLQEKQVERAVRTCTRLLGVPVDPVALNASMRLDLRLTRDFKMASVFAEEGGPQSLLKLTEKSTFPGAIPLATLLLRHVVEDIQTLQQTIEKVIIGSASHGIGNIVSGVGQNSLGTKEFHFVLRSLGSAACRCPEVFTESLKRLMRIQLPSQLKRAQSDEHELAIPPNSPQIVKVLQHAKSSTIPSIHGAMVDLATALMDSLVELYVNEIESKGKEKMKQESQPTEIEETKENLESTSNNDLTEGITQQANLVRRLTGEPVEDDDAADERARQRLLSSGSQEDPTGSSGTSGKDKQKEAQASKSNKPLFSNAVVLRILAELSKTYPSIAKLVSEHIYQSRGNQKALKFEGPILAFILDYLLPAPTHEGETSNVSSLARTLLAVVGSCNQLSEVQNAVILELKGSLARALSLMESKLKHVRLQALFNLIVTVIESSGPQIMNTSGTPQNFAFVKLLIKKGVISDLARTPHSLDLSSPSLVATVNSMLKPLEKLSSLANHQVLGSKTEGKDENKEATARATEQSQSLEVTQLPVEGPTSIEMQPDGQDEEQASTVNNMDQAEPIRPSEEAESTNDPEAIVSSQSEEQSGSSQFQFEDIVDQILRPRGEGDPHILGETLVTRTQDGQVVRERIVIEARREEGGGDSSSSSITSSSSDDEMSDDDSDGSGWESPRHEDEGNSAGEEVVDSDDDIDHTQQSEAQNDSEAMVITIGGNRTDADETMDGGNQDDEDEGNNEDAETEILGDVGDDPNATFDIEEVDEGDEDEGDDDDDQDDDGNDEEGSEMDADDNVDMIEDPINFFPDDNNAFDGDEDEGVGVEISFPRRPYAVHFPMNRSADEETSNGTSGNRNSVLQHPLLSRQTTTEQRVPGTQRASRVRGVRGDRIGQRHQTHTLHFPHPQGLGTSIARILVGEDIRFVNRGIDESVGDDILDLSGDPNDSYASPVQSVPGALSRWAFESKLLDGISMHDCVNSLKPEILQYLEKLLEKDLEQKREEERNKKKEAADKLGKSAETQTETTTATDSVKKEGSEVQQNLVSNPQASSSSEQTIHNEGGVDDRAMETGESTSQVSVADATEISRPSVNFAPHTIPQQGFAQPDLTLMEPVVPISQDLHIQQRLVSDPVPFPTSASPNEEGVPWNRAMETLPTETVLLPTMSRTATPALSSISSRPHASAFQTPISTLPIVTAADNITSPDLRTPSCLSQPISQPPSVATVPTTASIGTNVEGTPALQPPVGSWSMITPQSTIPVFTPAAPALQRYHHHIDSSVDASVTASDLAADLAAAIMSQLATSPTPVTSSASTAITNANGVNQMSSTQEGTSTQNSRGIDAPNMTESLSHSASSTSAAPLATQTENQTRPEEPLLPISAITAALGIENPSSSIPSSNEPQPGPSGEQRSNEVDGIQIPEGVDPSFLAALPESIRAEVLRDHFGMQNRQPDRPREPATATSLAEVSPEFLAALPPEVQEEVLEQQRLEQARLLAQQQAPEQPVDPAAFIRNLTPSLRRQVLADMDDTVVAVLPDDLTTEAMGLRRELEQRQAQYFQDRSTVSMFSQLLRHSGFTARRTLGGSLMLTNVNRLPAHSHGTWGIRQDGANGSLKKVLSRQLLDHESLTCLLVLLFLDEPKLNTGRLHRVLRNLSYHSGTRSWIVRGLLSILRRTSGLKSDGSCPFPFYSSVEKSSPQKHTSRRKRSWSGTDTMPSCSDSNQEMETGSVASSQWLSRTLDTSLGSRVDLFEFHRTGKSGSDRTSNYVTIHPHATSHVCKRTLEALAFLAKNFPTSFAPFSAKAEPSCTENESSKAESKEKSGDKGSESDTGMDFWDILIRLNSFGPGRRGKSLMKSHKEVSKDDTESFDNSPVGQVLSMLSHPVIKRNTTLTDKLLRLLAVITMSMPEAPKRESAKPQHVELMPPTTNTQDHAHTVTFTGVDTVVEGVPTGREQRANDLLSSQINENTQHAEIEPQDDGGITHFSETASITSSLVVEGSPIPIDSAEMLIPGSRSPRAESIFSVMSDGTVAAHSDYSGPVTEAHEEPMEIDRMSHPISDTSSSGTRASPVSISIPILSLTSELEKEPVVIESQLRLAVNVLTSGVCSEDGLEDATTLLLQLSRIDSQTRDVILSLLLEGGRDIAYTLCGEIKALLEELRAYNAKQDRAKHGHNKQDRASSSKAIQQRESVIVNPTAARSQPWRGRGRSTQTGFRRVGGAQAARNTATKPIIFDLHLPSMASLNAKRSSQSLLLKVLKVVLQLREAAKRALKGLPGDAQSRGMRLIERLNSGRGNLREVVAALEADVEAMYEIIDRFGGRRGQAAADGQQPAQPAQPAPQPVQPQQQPPAQQQIQPAQPQQNEGEDRLLAEQAPAQIPVANAIGGDQAEPSGQAQDVDQPADAAAAAAANPDEVVSQEPPIPQFPRLSTQIILDELWDVLGECLGELAETSDANAVLVLQPAVEAFFLVHGSEKDETADKNKPAARDIQRELSISSLDMPLSPAPTSPGGGAPLSPSRLLSVSSISSDLPPDTQKFLRFAETHRVVLNQILRQSTTPLADGPFGVLVNHTRLLDFDVKRRYFRQELEKMDKGVRREDMAVHVRRDHVFEDSYRELHRKSNEEIKNRLYIVFDGEEGQDAGGLLREWYLIIAREMFNPNYVLFTISQGDKTTYVPNRNSHWNPNHLSYFKFVGRVVAKAIYDNKLLDCYFTRSFYKHILGKSVHFTDMEAEDYGFYQGLVYLMEHNIDELGYELTFSVEVPVFGLNEIHDLKPNGRNIPVSEETKREYVKFVCQEKMTGSIRQQIDSFLEGFYEIIPKRLISIFDEQELELLIAGLPTIDIEDLRANSEYHKYDANSLQIQWFWRALRSCEQADRAKFLQFVTGTSKVPLQGFATLEGMNGPQKFQIHRDDRSTDRLPCAHTCFNQLDLPAYETYDKLYTNLLKAIQECPEGFGLA